METESAAPPSRSSRDPLLMKGLRLFVRPSGDSDQEMVSRFYRSENAPQAPPGEGVIGKLLGEITSHVTLEWKTEAVHIRHIWVARELRAKGVARLTIEEIGALARSRGCTRLIVSRACELSPFFLRIGFVETEEGLARPISPKAGTP